MNEFLFWPNLKTTQNYWNEKRNVHFKTDVLNSLNALIFQSGPELGYRPPFSMPKRNERINKSRQIGCTTRHSSRKLHSVQTYIRAALQIHIWWSYKWEKNYKVGSTIRRRYWYLFINSDWEKGKYYSLLMKNSAFSLNLYAWINFLSWLNILYIYIYICASRHYSMYSFRMSTAYFCFIVVKVALNCEQWPPFRFSSFESGQTIRKLLKWVLKNMQTFVALINSIRNVIVRIFFPLFLFTI